VACCRRGWLRTPAPHAADELGHLERGLRGLLAAGKLAGIFTGPLIPIAATVVGLGLDEAEKAILDTPEVEDWTIERIAAKRAAVKEPTT